MTNRPKYEYLSNLKKSDDPSPAREETRESSISYSKLRQTIKEVIYDEYYKFHIKELSLGFITMVISEYFKKTKFPIKQYRNNIHVIRHRLTSEIVNIIKTSPEIFDDIPEQDRPKLEKSLKNIDLRKINNYDDKDD